LLVAALVAAAAFVAQGRGPDAVGGFSSDAAEFSTLVPATVVRHVSHVAPAPRNLAVAPSPPPLLALFLTMGLALWGATEGRCVPRAERWLRRRGPPVAR
jgi:hypothetical protein